MLGNTYCTDEGQVQDGAEDWYSSDKAHDNWEETPGWDESDRENKLVRILIQSFCRFHKVKFKTIMNKKKISSQVSLNLHFPIAEE